MTKTITLPVFISLLLITTNCSQLKSENQAVQRPIQANTGESRHYREKDYQVVWCERVGGEVEYVLENRTRVDCLTEEYAIEFDFARKWAESIGQALYYALETDRKPGVVLIIEDPKDERYLERLLEVSEEYEIKVWVIGPSDLGE